MFAAEWKPINQADIHLRYDVAEPDSVPRVLCNYRELCTPLPICPEKAVSTRFRSRLLAFKFIASDFPDEFTGTFRRY